MAEPAVTFLLENVQKLLVDHIKLVSGAENELRLLQNDLLLMKAFLEESANKREKGELFRQNERQIREAVYKAEDTIDACLTQAAAAERSKGFAIKNLSKRLDLAKKVKSIREEDIQPVFFRARMDFGNLPIDREPVTTTQNPHTLKSPLLREDNLVGFEDEAETLVKYINEESDELDVISVVGMPGLGKTTLAWKIYRDQKIAFEFPIKIWVYVSQDYNIKEVFLTILKKLTQQDMSKLKEQELAEKVRHYLHSSKFILFLDDIWSGEAWNLIAAALPKKNGSGKVLITSRDEQVARLANPKRDPHKLRFLNQQESWELLQLEVFARFDDCPSELNVLGKRIAKQCGGVPLAIVVIGGILLKKLSESGNVKEEWEKVSNSVSAHQLSYDAQNRTENIILLSYNKLPHDLRDCFVYLGVFPEDTEIPTWKLIRLWIAEGFVQQKAEKCLEEVAEDNLKELVARNLVMVDKVRASGEIKACRVHDMIREFCINQAAFAKQNVYQEVKNREGEFYPATSEILKSRRLCIHSYVVDFLRKKPKGPLVRSFMCFSKEAINLQAEYVTAIPEAFSLLRVLDVNPIKFPKFPSKITHLIHLRYIAISGDNLNALPDAAFKLWNLQTIRIDTTSRSFEIKADISKMTQLRHLKTKAAIVVKEMKGRAESLQTLSRLSAECRLSDVLGKTPNLKNLGIRGKLDSLSEDKCLEKLNRLQKLKLVHDVFPAVKNEKPLSRLPQPERFPPNLKILKLSSTFLDWRKMDTTLGKLPNLEVLKLKENAFMGEIWQADGQGFPSLQYLQIARTDLEFWSASGDHPFPKLRCLVLKNCERLEEIPSVLKKSLQVLDIERVTKSIVEFGRELEREKLQNQDQLRERRGGFKLILAPGDGR
ncbi:hypothetical protein C2S53_008094 [Perilla frutescens var. hirtella]|uniref:Uncharacterized protein n=1 Tax=Perilla frutescens var. hirtella TaxID=608512 RepID=A0AAD4IWZ9_PERFH|nr:hypothetical protein C2S53_008094 [Perilla frutescens var. hirtella]